MKDLIKRDKQNVLLEIKLTTRWLILNKNSLTVMEELKLCEALEEAVFLIHERHKE